MAGIINSVKSIYTDLVTGNCGKNFKAMSHGDKFVTVLKVAGVAALAGIIAGVLGAFGGGIFGFLAGVTIMGVVGVAAFAYFTSEHSLGEQVADCAKKCAHIVKEAL